MSSSQIKGRKLPKNSVPNMSLVKGQRMTIFSRRTINNQAKSERQQKGKNKEAYSVEKKFEDSLWAYI